MSHDDAFAEFVARKREREAAAPARFSWRKATGGDPHEQVWSGYGPGGLLIFVAKDDADADYRYGMPVCGIRVSQPDRRQTLAAAKQAAVELAQAHLDERRVHRG